MRSQAIRRPLLKRVMDTTLAGGLVVVTLPVSVAATAAMAVDMLVRPRDRGPFLYRERRVSRGREFDLLKVRTLRREVHATQSGAEAHARPLEADPSNLTWAGRRVLKPWYLDELPQLVNVLRGDLSLVGPRPWPPSMVRGQVDAGLDYRLHVLAGWTGPAQVAKDVTRDHADAALDLAYLEACRTWGALRLARHDLGILRRTLGLIVRGEGLRY